MLKRYKEFKDNRKKYKGFTLIELLAVLLILFIVFSIVIYSFTDVFKSSKEIISNADRNIILSAANDYALEYRGSEGWVEEVKDNGKVVNFCVSLDSLINYGYFKNNESNFEKYKDKYVVEFEINNGVTNYKFIDIKDSGFCKFKDFSSSIEEPNINYEIENENDSNVGEFNYVINKISDKKYAFGYDLTLNLISVIKDIYVTLIVDRSSSMNDTPGKYAKVKNEASNFSSQLVNNNDVNVYISLIMFDRNPSYVRGFEKKALSSSIFTNTGSGTNFVSGLDMAISLLCHNGLDSNPNDSQWCANISGGKLKKDFKSYTILFFDGDNNYVPTLEYNSQIFDGKFIKNNNTYKEIYYREFLNASEYGSIFLKDNSDLYTNDFYDNYLSNSVSYLKNDLDSNLFFIGYEYASTYGNRVRTLASSGNKLCVDGYEKNGEKYCYYDSTEDNLEIIMEKVKNNIINNSKISSIEFIFESVKEKKSNEDVITFYNSEDVLSTDNILRFKYDNLNNYEENLKKSMKGYKFVLNDVVYDMCSEFGGNNVCLLNNQELFTVKMNISYTNGASEVVDIDSPIFNLTVEKLKTIN